MCIDSDLFGDVIVTVKDVQLWLDSTAIMGGRNHTQREHYVKNYDVANKIKQSKLDGSFVLLMDKAYADKNYADKPISLFETKYKIDTLEVIKTACPLHFHICQVHDCAIYLSRTKIEKNRRSYLKRRR